MKEEIWNLPLSVFFGEAVKGKNQFEQHEVLELMCIKPYQLRFWESEFDIIRPMFSSQGANYSERDLKILLRIKKLLLEEQLTVEKVKALLDLELSHVENLELEVSHNDNEQIEEKIAMDDQVPVQQSFDIEASMNMNTIFEEMSLETFQEVEKAPAVVDSSESEKITQIKTAITNLKLKIKEQFKLLKH